MPLLITSGSIFARAAYKAAEIPAGPAPIMIIFSIYFRITCLSYDSNHFHILLSVSYTHLDVYKRQPHLNVMIPVENSGVTEGYVTYHYDMQRLYQKRSGPLGILQMVFFAVYALCGLLLLCYQKWIHTPMQQIIKGASEYANGDLSSRIPVKSEDEMGYLAKTLNYMADKINQNGEYQRTFIANVSHLSLIHI